MVNPLVLKFCLWFLSTLDFDIPHRDECYDTLTSCVAKCIDFKVLDTDDVRRRNPAIQLLDAHLENSKIQFFGDSLKKCKHVTTLHMKKFEKRYMATDTFKGVSHIVGLMNRDFLDRLTKIIIDRDTFKLKETDNKSIILSIDAQYNGAIQLMKLLLQKCGLSKRKPQIYLRIEGLAVETSDITRLLCRYVKHLYIGDHTSRFCVVEASAAFPHCPILTHLTMRRCDIDSSVSRTLRRAIQNGKLPRLRRVTMIDCRNQGPRSDWPEEVEVTMITCYGQEPEEVRLEDILRADKR